MVSRPRLPDDRRAGGSAGELRQRTGVLLTTVFLALFGPGCLAQTVTTGSGPVTGQQVGDIFEFLGVPFAAPPVGELRWRPTEAPASWSQPVLADAFPPPCPQKRFLQGEGDEAFVLEGEEDCLYLNVWSGDLKGERPVMVFIHGGGNQQGSTGQISGGTQIYLGRHLAERGEVVLVTVQYRLGALGYLVHPGLAEESPMALAGNYGVMDQLFALEWVRSNIQAFGGDPNNVTIFGQSAGALNVANLLITPLAEGLFHRAIIQSGAFAIEDLDVAMIEGQEFVERFVDTGSDAERIDHMRSLPATTIVLEDESPLSGGVARMAWEPVLDGHVFRDDPVDALRTGAFNRVPVMVGSTADEMRLSVPAGVFPFMVEALINQLVPEDLRALALQLYPPGDTEEEARDALVGLLTDSQFTVNARRIARCVSQNQKLPVFRYLFTHSHNPAIPLLGDAKSYHGIELFYIFNTWEDSPLAFGPLFTPEDDSVQDIALAYWTRFAQSGDPNDTSLPHWPAYDIETNAYLDLDASPQGSDNGPRTAESDLWDQVAGFGGCASSVPLFADSFEAGD